MAGPALSRFRDLRLALSWGALWGTALGIGLVAPQLLELQRLAPRTLPEWLVAQTSFIVLFGTGGAFLNVLACAPLVLWRGLRGRDLGSASLAFGLNTPPLLVFVYLVWSAGIEGVAFRGLSVLETYRPLYGGLLAAMTVWCGAVWFLYDRLADRPRAPVRLGAFVVSLALVAAISLYLRSEPPNHSRSETHAPPVPLEKAGNRAPILFVGIDGANWRTLRPLIERGDAPTFARLAGSGTAGEIRALWPPYWSAPAWAAILSGFPRETTGIYEDLAIFAPGLPPFQAPFSFGIAVNPVLSTQFVLGRLGVIRLAHPTRAMLGAPPFWEPLSAAGLRTAVVRFRFTFPADGRADVLVSDWVGEDQWSLAGVDLEAPREALVAPAEEAHALLAPFEEEVSPAVPSLDRFVADPERPEPLDSAVGPIGMLRFAAGIDGRTLEASRNILARHPETELLAVYLGGLDTVLHAFWQYRFPGDFPHDPPAASDVAELGPVIDRYLAWLDESVGSLLDRFSSPPNVVIVSDHGYEAMFDHVLFKGWHAAEGGVFLAAGPEVPRRSGEIEVSYLDVAPTVLWLAGFAPSGKLPGKTLFSGAVSLPP